MENENYVTEGFAFNAISREKTDLERELGLTLRMSDQIPEDISPFIGKFVQLSTSDSRYVGVLRGITPKGNYVMKPTLFRSAESILEEGMGERGGKVFNWIDREKLFSGEFKELARLDERVLDAIGVGFDRVKHLGEYIESPKKPFPYC